MSRLVEHPSVGCGSKVSSGQSELAAMEAAVDSLRDLVYGSAK